MAVNSVRRKSTWSYAELCGPLLMESAHCVGVQGAVRRMTGAPRCLYCRRSRRAGCRSLSREDRSPRPWRMATRASQPKVLNNFKSLSINIPSSSGIGARRRRLAGRPREPPRRDIGGWVGKRKTVGLTWGTEGRGGRSSGGGRGVGRVGVGTKRSPPLWGS
jgi:hypothetical protein